MVLQGKIVDIKGGFIFNGSIAVENGRIKRIEANNTTAPDHYILPGFIDAHVHIESAMMVPSAFARLAVLHGTVATVSDPHEIANVLGLEGVSFMINNGKQVPFKFNFGAPSCVPATTFETAGARLGVKAVTQMLSWPEIGYLSEMMNFPGVLNKDPEIMAKIDAAKKMGKPIDGHAPGLRGKQAKKYAKAGISTDHECVTYEEALEKIGYGMKILIREGSAAKNFEALIPLMEEHPEQLMFCTDDKHPDELLHGHINELVARAVGDGYPLFNVLKAACIHPVEHYKLPVGLLKTGDPADFIVVKDLDQFKVLSTYIDGKKVADFGQCLFPPVPVKPINRFNTRTKNVLDFQLAAQGKKVRVIEAINKAIITEGSQHKIKVEDGLAVADQEKDILKIAVINRYQDAPPAMAFIKNFHLKDGAIASCVAHDSHNIIAVGTDDELICKAVNLIIENKGGISAVSPNKVHLLPLEVAGIMSKESGEEVAENYAAIDQFVKAELKSNLDAPFMTLSFMGLLVIPKLKLSDKGLFDGEAFNFVSLFV